MDIPATLKKLREASHFYDRLAPLALALPSQAEEYDFLLSAFLSAARSVTFALQVEQKSPYDAWFPAWRSQLPQEDQDLLARMVDLRNQALKRGESPSVEVQVFIAITRLPPEHRAKACGVSWFGPPGSPPPEIGFVRHMLDLGESVQEASALCRRYLELLNRLVTDFKDAHP
ncbi:MAG TPA: hypothetical protein VLH79_09040 [Chthonomonadales bacterium]|nr:hypothetical protein [Chthonomonadales bacterium]